MWKLIKVTFSQPVTLVWEERRKAWHMLHCAYQRRRKQIYVNLADQKFTLYDVMPNHRAGIILRAWLTFKNLPDLLVLTLITIACF